MWTEQFNSMLILMVMAALLRYSYELSGPTSNSSKEIRLFADTLPNKEVPKPISITPQQREWAEKAVNNYAQSQEKKWQRWNEAMFEKVK
ncbi:hypothetical protein VLL09_04910 [Dehalococcoides mccartyi]|uniref:Uncharacterized protein n=1 Tax=Dehalococcoides mccartyi TaxID=61435 RepID=A0AB38Z816_9CHLR|nr:hypothetical protein [Dehalococcoides mccartyi]WRO06733.1 hypothetical protein VLL09_04910 [Dehalococcoides mccartyi]